MECWSDGVWSRLPDLRLPREGPGVVDHDSKLYVIGGRGGGGTVEVYDPAAAAWSVLEQKLVGQDQEYTAIVLDRVV